MNQIKLSLIDKFYLLSLQEVIDFCLDNNIDTIINNFSSYSIEYTLSDLAVVSTVNGKTIWDNIVSATGLANEPVTSFSFEPDEYLDDEDEEEWNY